jgi:hypothetical protein
MRWFERILLVAILLGIAGIIAAVIHTANIAADLKASISTEYQELGKEMADKLRPHLDSLYNQSFKGFEDALDKYGP